MIEYGSLYNPVASKSEKNLRAEFIIKPIGHLFGKNTLIVKTAFSAPYY